MIIFQYPFIIITILVFCIIIAGAIAVYFAMKGAKAANQQEEKGFCSTARLEKEYRKLSSYTSEKSCLIYIGVNLDDVKKIHSEAKAQSILNKIKNILLKNFVSDNNGLISEHKSEVFIVLNSLEEEKNEKAIHACMTEINKIFTDNETVNTADVHFGYYNILPTAADFSTAVIRAKQAFTLAKDSNKTLYTWDSKCGKKLEQKIKIENNIQSEIENNRFFLEYQPIIDSATKKIVGAEVLSRLNSESDGIISPRDFLSAVDSVGINDKFDYYIFKKNCMWISNNKTEREKYFYAINFSRSTLCSSSFSDTMLKIIDDYGLTHTSLAIEILEDKNLSAEQKNTLMSNLSILKEKGVSILLDDFGSGFTSFTDLNDFKVNIVKIDRIVTQNAVTDNGFVILSNIIKTAKDLGFKTLCEGVENEEQEEKALRAGCDMLQGYYYYRPMPVAQLEELLTKQKTEE